MRVRGVPGGWTGRSIIEGVAGGWRVRYHARRWFKYLLIMDFVMENI
jgi:hypothetical protein